MAAVQLYSVATNGGNSADIQVRQGQVGADGRAAVINLGGLGLVLV